MIKHWALLFFLLSVLITKAKETNKHALIAVHVEIPVKADFKQKIFPYHFLNVYFTGREELLTIQGKQGGRDNIRTNPNTCML